MLSKTWKKLENLYKKTDYNPALTKLMLKGCFNIKFLHNF